MTRVAAIDCGTNSIRLLVADHDVAADTLTDRLRRTELVRLGQDVDRTGRLAPEAIERTRVALASTTPADCEREQVEQVRMVATSATRDAGNRDDFRAMVLRPRSPWSLRSSPAARRPSCPSSARSAS